MVGALGAAGVGWGVGRPNLVVFLSEGHAARDVGAAETPHLNGMGAAGLRMKLAFAPEALGSSSRSSVLTGLYPLRHGAYEEFSFVRRDVGRTWAHRFRELGYRVTLAGEARFGPRQAFPFEYQPLASVGRYLGLRHEKPYCLVVCLPGLEEFAGETLAEAKAPGYVVDTAATRRWMARYRLALRGMDAWIGEALERITGNTITVYLSVHGPSLPFAKWSLYDAGMRVPLVVRWPGVVKAGESEAMVSLVDVLPTLVEACGGRADGTDGRSFLGVLQGKVAEHRPEVFAVHHNRGSVSGSDFPIRAVRTRRYKYIVNLKHWNQFGNMWTHGNDGSDSRNPVRSGPSEIWREWLAKSATDGHAQGRVGLHRFRPAEELYDVQADGDELQNLAMEDVGVAVKGPLREKLVGWMREQKDGWLGFVE